MYTLADLPRRGAARHGSRTAVVFEDTRLTYDQLNRRVNQAAHTLADLGLEPGERLTVLSDNSARYLETYLAAAKLGVSVTPLNTRLSDAELDYIVTDSEAVAIVVGDWLRGEGGEAAGDRAGAPLRRLPRQRSGGFHGLRGRRWPRRPSDEPDPARGPSEDDLAVLMYTGGTTGAPKGVMLSHRNVMTATIADAITLEFTKDDSTCFVLPIFHVSWWPILSLLLVGGKVVINRTPDLNEILRLIQDEQCTHMNSVPTIYGWLMDMAPVDSYDLQQPALSHLRRQPDRRRGAQARDHRPSGRSSPRATARPRLQADRSPFSRQKITTSRERTAACWPARARRRSARRSRSSTTTTRRVEPGAIGEVCVRGKHIMMGYWKNPELTATALTRRLVPHRRPGLPRRTRLPVPDRPQVRHDHQRRRERVPQRGGERPSIRTPRSSSARWSPRLTSGGARSSTPSSSLATASRSPARRSSSTAAKRSPATSVRRG